MSNCCAVCDTWMNLHLYAKLASSVETTGTETHEEYENIQYETALHSAPALIKKSAVLWLKQCLAVVFLNLFWPDMFI